MSVKQIISAGDLKHKLTIIAETTQKDELGGNLTQWLPVSNLPLGQTWAHVAVASAYSRVNAHQMGQVLTHEITMRYKPWLNDSMAIFWKSRNRYFKILSVSAMDEETRLVTVRTEERRDILANGI